jgi:molybdopterin molybdotransferase
VKVFSTPSVGLLSTGDELVEPSQKPEGSQIRNSNSWQLMAQLQSLGINPSYYGIVSDDASSLEKILSKSIAENDLTILTGGVSMGDFDFVPGVFAQLGLNILFDSIAIQPGKPSTMAISPDGKVCYGLPGNPVSSFFQFELLIKPIIYLMMGNRYSPPHLSCLMGSDYERKRSGRLSLLPVSINNKGEAVPVDYHGSAHINTLLSANGFIFIPAGKNIVSKGEQVDVRLF